MIYSKPHLHFLISLGSHAVQLLPSKSSLTCRQAIVNTLGTTAWTSMAPTFWRKSSSHRRRSPFNAIPFVMVIHASCASIVRAAFVNAGVWLPPSGDGIVNEGWRDGKAVFFDRLVGATFENMEYWPWDTLPYSCERWDAIYELSAYLRLTKSVDANFSLLKSVHTLYRLPITSAKSCAMDKSIATNDKTSRTPT